MRFQKQNGSREGIKDGEVNRACVPSRPSFPSRDNVCLHHRGFTLVELLAVIAIIGILAAIIVPTVSGARTAANKAKTRVQFSQWATAIEQFRQEYGAYPGFGPQNLVNPTGTSSAPGAGHLFHDVLVARRRDGSALPAAPSGPASDPAPPEAQNTRCLQFISFGEGDIYSPTYTDATKRGLIHDALGNTEIAVLVDRNLDGVINAIDYPNYPTVRGGGGTIALRPSATDLPETSTGGVRAGVIFYSAAPGATDSSQLILSWK